MSKKHKKIEGFGKNLVKAFVALDKYGKREADWFFGEDLKHRNPYGPPENYENAADEFFDFKKKKPNKKIVVINV